MEKLKQANLYNADLIKVSGKLVERYNKCLYTLGFEQTKLTHFTVDGVGWSPEIAEEKGNPDYLNHGEANPHGIIISPLQKNKPIYGPFHSFDRDMMRFVFKTYEKKINDITRDSAICLDFDQHIDAYYEPSDLLRYDMVTIRFRLIDKLEEKQKEQQELIRKFNSKNNFINESVHEELLESAKAYGDLRNRDLTLPDLYHKTGSFYTRAFKGVFLLRDFISPIMVFEDMHWYKQAIKDTTHNVLMYHISQPELVEKLRDHLIIECDLQREASSPRYERIKSYVFAQCLTNVNHSIKDILENKALFKSYLNKIDIEARKKVMGVERYVEKLKTSNQHKIKDMVDRKIYEALHRPHSSLETEHQDLIWQLIVNISSLDVLFLYWYDKPQFYNNYQNWSDGMKDWVIDVIKQNI